MTKRLFILFWAGLSLNFFLFSANAAAETTDLHKQIMVIADIHFNPFADCDVTIKACPEALELNKANVSDWTAIFSKYNTQNYPGYGQETNYQLFSSLLAEIKQQKPENILILGDFLAHRFRIKYFLYTKDRNKKDYQQFVLNTLQYITQSIQAASPNKTSIFPVIGNHDSYVGKGCRKAPFCSEVNGSFFKKLTPLWAPLIRDEINRKQFLSTFPAAGYYAINLPNNNHLLVLNTVLFSSRARGHHLKYGAHAEIVWLAKQLSIYQKADQKTWIAWHIPPGIDAESSVRKSFRKIRIFWREKYTQKVLNLVNRHIDIIAGVYSGHLHMDSFLILNADKNKITLIDSLTPAISPIFGNNAAYKIYDYDSNNLNWCNYSTYYFDAIWKKEYTFNSSFQADSKDCTLIPGFSKIFINFNNPFTQNYLKFYNVSANFKPLTQKTGKPFWCAIHNLSRADYQNCLLND